MKIAAAYIRVSTDDQLEYSPDSQLKIIQEYAKKNEMVLSKDFIFMEDDGVSGRNAQKRPQFMKMISLAKQVPSPFQVILVWKFSRFARNREESVVYKSLLRKQCNVDVISISEPIMDGPFGSLIESIIEWMDEYYSVNLSGEVRRGMTEKATRGGIVAGPAFGYDVINGEYQVNSEEAPIVQMIFDDYRNGMGCREIAVKLNERNICTKRGNPFENRTVEYILRNPVYIGKIHWNKEKKTDRHFNMSSIIINDGKHTPIIDQETFYQVQALLQKQRNKYAFHAKKIVKQEFMLRGVVKCSNCGSSLVLSMENGVQCHSYAKGRCTKSHYIKLDLLNEAVLSLMEKLLRSNNFVLINKEIPLSNETDLLLNRQHVMLSRASDAYLSGIYTISEYKEIKNKIETEIQRLEALRPKPLPQKSREAFAKTHLDSVKKLRSKDMSEKEKNELLRSFVERIVFNRTTNQLDIIFYQ